MGRVGPLTWLGGHYGNSCVSDTGLPYMGDLIQSSNQPSFAQEQVKTSKRLITAQGAELPLSDGSFPLALCFTQGVSVSQGYSLPCPPLSLPYSVHQGGRLQGERAVLCT